MASIGEGSETGNIRNVIRIDEGEIRNHLDGLVKTSVEEVLNQYLDYEADHLCCTKRYERSPGRVDTRSGSYNGKLQTKAARSPCRCPVCGRCFLRPKSLNGTSTVNPVLRRP